MSEALATRQEFTLGQEQVQLLARTLSDAGLSQQEFYLFIEYVKRTKLDPFVRQLYAIKDKGRMSIIVGIDGLRVIAQRTGELDGQDGPYWKAQDGPWLEVWDSEEPPFACKVEVYRQGCKRPFRGLVRYDSFARFKDGKPVGNWATMPDHMMSIRAESHALRKAFPAETAGLYVSQDDQESDGEVYIVNPDAKASNDQIAALHLTAQELGWTDEQRRAFHGDKSAAELTSGEASHYLTLMKKLVKQRTGLAGAEGSVERRSVASRGAETSDTEGTSSPAESSGAGADPWGSKGKAAADEVPAPDASSGEGATGLPEGAPPSGDGDPDTSQGQSEALFPDTPPEDFQFGRGRFGGRWCSEVAGSTDAPALRERLDGGFVAASRRKAVQYFLDRAALEEST